MRGLDGQRLGLVGRLALAKRLAKIALVLPATVHCIHHHAPELITPFANQCLPTSASRYANAQQFHDYLHGLALREADAPAYLWDLAACEFLVATAGWEARQQPDVVVQALPVTQHDVFQIRTRPCLRLHDYTYDVRPLIENPQATPPMTLPRVRGTLAVVIHTQGPRLFGISEEVGELLRLLEPWTTFDTCSSAMFEVLSWLHQHGFIEVELCASV